MNLSDAKVKVRAEAHIEAQRDAAEELRTQKKLRIMKHASILSGICLMICVISVIPFLAGFPLHKYWESVGKYLIMSSMGLLPVFALTTALAYTLWSLLRSQREIHKKYAPPGYRPRS